MENNHILAKWLNNDLTEGELAEFKANPEYEKYEKIKNYTAHLEVPPFIQKTIMPLTVKEPLFHYPIILKLF